MIGLFKLGQVVWRVQGTHDSEQGLYVHGPAIVTAIINRATRITYLLTWEREGTSSIEGRDEQLGKALYLSHEGAQASADRQHNEYLDSQKRRIA